MIKILRDTKNKKYKYISRFIKKSLIKIKDDLPKNLYVKIYNYTILNQKGNRYIENETAIYRNKKDYLIRFNLKQLKEVFFDNKVELKLKRKCNFKDYLLFNLYHEIGHYIKHYNGKTLKEAFKKYDNHKNICEREANKYSIDKMKENKINEKI